MKKITLAFFAALIMLAFTPNTVMAGKRTNKSTITSGRVSDPVKSAAISTRLGEIRTMNFTDMSRAEKKELRGELRTIRANMNELDGGAFYISGGALIVIILLLILLL